MQRLKSALDWNLNSPLRTGLPVMDEGLGPVVTFPNKEKNNTCSYNKYLCQLRFCLCLCWLCSPLKIFDVICDYRTKQIKQNTWIPPFQSLKGSGEDTCRQLQSGGFFFFLIRWRPENWVPGVVQTASVVLDLGWPGLFCCSVEHDQWLAEGAVQKDKRRGTFSHQTSNLGTTKLP